MAGKGKSKTSPVQLEVEEKQVRAQGCVSFRVIPEELGYSSASGAHAAVMAALEKKRAEPAESLRELMLTRLDVMLTGLWDAAINGDPESVAAVLRIEERRAKLLGLDKVAPPVMMAVNRMSVGGVDFSRMSNDELREIIRQGEEERDGDAELARRKMAGRSLIDFIQFMSPAYQAGWVHCELAAALERFLAGVRRRESPRLMVFMPPRHGKLEQVSRYFPAWAFGRNPDLSMIASSYAADLTSRMNRDVQRIIDNPCMGRFSRAWASTAKNIRTVANVSNLRKCLK